MVDRRKYFEGIKYLLFHSIKFISRRLGQRFSTKIGQHVYGNKYQFGFEYFMTVETNLGSSMFRHRLVLYRGINCGKRNSILLQNIFHEGGISSFNVGTTYKTVLCQLKEANSERLVGFKIYSLQVREENYFTKFLL